LFHGGYDCAGRPPSPINRMQNLVAHHDDKINDDLMWQALTGGCPAFSDSSGRRDRPDG